MKSRIPYSEIAKAERRALAAEAYRTSPTLRRVRFLAFFIPFMFAAALSRELALGKDIQSRLVVTLPSAGILCVLIWEVFGRPRLRAEIERIKNG